MTIDNLIEAIDSDKEDSRIKEAAKLLLAAMNDWPTFNQSELTDFIREFKADFGDEFTINELEQQSTNDNWKNEAQGSIIEC